MHFVRNTQKNPPRKNVEDVPQRPCDPNYNLHEKAGGSPLPRFTASNVRNTSVRGREACNRRGKYSVP